jgi:hypothetical protein
VSFINIWSNTASTVLRKYIGSLKMPYSLIDSEDTTLSSQLVNSRFDTYEEACKCALQCNAITWEFTLRMLREYLNYATVYGILCNVTNLHCMIDLLPIVLDEDDKYSFEKMMSKEVEIFVSAEVTDFPIRKIAQA